MKEKIWRIRRKIRQQKARNYTAINSIDKNKEENITQEHFFSIIAKSDCTAWEKRRRRRRIRCRILMPWKMQLNYLKKIFIQDSEEEET